MSTQTVPRLVAPAAARMTLANIVTGAVETPDKIVIVGTEGVGKSTFGANSRNPIFIAGEEGVEQIGPNRFPAPKSWQDVVDAIDVLTNQEHNFKTLVVDTIDWIEPLAYKEVCRRNGWGHIEDAGYGKGFGITTDMLWRPLLQQIDILRAKTGMEVILLAHTNIKNFTNPAGPDYSRYEAAISKTTYGVLKQWADSVLFAAFDENIVDAKTGKEIDEVGTKKRVKAIVSGERVLHTERRAAWDAKNRYDLPETMPLSYADYAAHRTAFYEKKKTTNPTVLMAEAQAMVPHIAPEKVEAVSEHLSKIANDGPALLQAVNRLKALVAEAKKEN